MGKPIARKQGICLAFPDTLNTPQPSGPMVPLPYPNIAQLADAVDHPTDVKAGGIEVITGESSIPTSSGGEAGTGGGLTSGTFNQKCEFLEPSQTVLANGSGIVRQLDPTKQNNQNTDGQVMVGFPTDLVGD